MTEELYDCVITFQGKHYHGKSTTPWHMEREPYIPKAVEWGKEIIMKRCPLCGEMHEANDSQG